ncbi:uncharacterized protein LOC112202458 isoform X2 [Rosa chinensis]|uniref:uncharacterized protein LOC112202458 isoform X2 n=2 Tax=Rosa chinensis TaxID=74649 RepID=UPI000D094290|nr:uncharacterized protein LOC112202458 isoform X2 [Rosa chinensis]
MRIMLENWKGALKRMWFTVRLRLRKKNWRMMRASLPPKMGVLRWVISIKIAIFEWNLVQRILTSKSCTLSLDASDPLHSSKDFGSLYKDLSNQPRLFQTQLSEIKKRLSYWTNPDKINNVDQLGQMEDSIQESCNQIQTHKRLHDESEGCSIY